MSKHRSGTARGARAGHGSEEAAPQNSDQVSYHNGMCCGAAAAARCPAPGAGMEAFWLRVTPHAKIPRLQAEQRDPGRRRSGAAADAPAGAAAASSQPHAPASHVPPDQRHMGEVGRDGAAQPQRRGARRFSSPAPAATKWGAVTHSGLSACTLRVLWPQVLLFTLPSQPRGPVERSPLQQALASLYNFFFKYVPIIAGSAVGRKAAAGTGAVKARGNFQTFDTGVGRTGRSCVAGQRGRAPRHDDSPPARMQGRAGSATKRASKRLARRAGWTSMVQLWWCRWVAGCGRARWVPPPAGLLPAWPAAHDDPAAGGRCRTPRPCAQLATWSTPLLGRTVGPPRTHAPPPFLPHHPELTPHPPSSPTPPPCCMHAGPARHGATAGHLHQRAAVLGRRPAHQFSHQPVQPHRLHRHAVPGC